MGGQTPAPVPKQGQLAARRPVLDRGARALLLQHQPRAGLDQQGRHVLVLLARERRGPLLASGRQGAEEGAAVRHREDGGAALRGLQAALRHDEPADHDGDVRREERQAHPLHRRPHPVRVRRGQGDAEEPRRGDGARSAAPPAGAGGRARPGGRAAASRAAPPRTGTSATTRPTEVATSTRRTTTSTSSRWTGTKEKPPVQITKDGERYHSFGSRQEIDERDRARPPDRPGGQGQGKAERRRRRRRAARRPRSGSGRT